MKSYTDIEQSKQLAKFLPSVSADMWWNIDLTNYPSIEENIGFHKESKEDIPCWSLTALLDFLDNYTIINNGYSGIVIWSSSWHSNEHDNPIDACYELILNLHKLKML